jgi:integrase
MAEKINFTQSRVKGIKPPLQNEGKEVRTTYHDKGQTKLNLRVSSTGSKTYYVSKKDKTGRLKNVRIGAVSEWTVEAARNMASDILSEINKGVDPNEEKRKAKTRSQTLQQLLDLYIDNHDLKPVTKADYQRKMKWGFSDWFKLPASSLTETMIISRHKKLTKRGKTATNGAFRPLRAVLNYSQAIGAIANNPTAILSTARLWHKSNRRNDLIQSHQLQEWIEAVETITPVMHKVAFLTMLYMGFRITETYSLEWKNVDLKNNLILQEDTKNGTDHELPIPTALLSTIEELKEVTGGGKYLFPAKNREGFAGYPKKPLEQINSKISFHFNPHMTRHTFTTISEAVGTPKTMIDRLTNHTTSNDITGGYIHTETETLRQAINKIAAYIQARVNQSEKVIRLYG